MPATMHADEIHTDVALVRRLVAAQFPAWAELPISAIDSTGTDHAIYRLGNEMAVRLPRIHWARGQAAKEAGWLPQLAPHLPLAVPVPLAHGQPAAGYPWEWSIYRWLPGTAATDAAITDWSQAAYDLAQFVAALQRCDPAGGPVAAEHELRGAPLATRDADTRSALAALAGMFDLAAMTQVWDTAVQAPAWDRAPVWFHGDLLPGNVLVEAGRVCAVIDFGGLGIGDPACDLMIAWSLFSGASRAAFRDALGMDAATWARGRGHALSQAALFIPYYLHSNPAGVSAAQRTIAAILSEQGG